MPGGVPLKPIKAQPERVRVHNPDRSAQRSNQDN